MGTKPNIFRAKGTPSVTARKRFTHASGRRVLAALGLSSLALATGSNSEGRKGFDSKEMGNFKENSH
jgi:hypothetical protein